jgi:hypothetical protein
MEKSADGHHWTFKRAGLNTFLMQKNVVPPEGYTKVSDLAQREGVNLSAMYNRIKIWGVDTIQAGPQRVMYVSEVSYEKRRKLKERIPLDE